MNNTVKMAFGLAVAATLSAAAAACGLVFGSKALTFADLQHYLFSDGPYGYNDWVIAGRIPRTLAAASCGAALGLAGALIQGLTRNPLGDSGLLGINAGAAAAIVSSASVPFLNGWSEFWLALCGAGVMAFLICSISLGRRNSSYAKLVLTGTAISAVLSAYVSAVSQLNPVLFDHLRFWSSGSFSGISLDDVRTMLPFAAPAATVGVMLGYHLNLIGLGAETARALGVKIVPIQLAVAATAAVLAGSAVAIAGPVGFVGLATAHITRLWTGNDYRWLLPYSVFTGAVLLVCSDVLARIVLAPSETTSGIIMSLVGAPLLYAVALHHQRAAK
ncbi:FecCD family ABC transporter permease [Neisseria iguanae]|uniref:Iron ABC transporter permease n=1 Tax=Neisseria iguanae TaxID=90242 RepID=A0A2P7U1B1_9NEIS|nr:iron ABC transporter permease [Neisseria iguanae]PSJ80749.1 iron ABC transporter permease [Neisseria iguanae]